MLRLSAFALVSILNLTLTSTQTVRAAVVNGSFETEDFNGWLNVGQTKIDGTGFGVTPADGNYQAVLETFQDQTGVSASQLETFLGLPLKSLTSLGAIEGSGIKQTIIAQAGDALSFSWNFLSDLDPPDSTFNDFAFFSIGNTVTSLADTFAPTKMSFSPLAKETGYQVYSYTIPVAGTYNLGFGIVDVGDSTVNSALLIDHLKYQPVPEPVNFSAAVIALVVGTWLRKRSQSGQN